MPTETNQDKQTHFYMQGIKNLIMDSLPDKKRIEQLHTYLDELDRRRNTNWRSIFPYLDIKI